MFKFISIAEASPIDIGEATAALYCTACGGISIFLGTTRAVTDGLRTLRLEYDCYPEMALQVMHQLADEAADRWELGAVALVHRTGVVPAGEASVFVGAAATHRAEAFEACRFLIDTLKSSVPIWKREHFADGTVEWVEGTRPEPRPER